MDEKILDIRTDLIQLLENKKSEMSVNVYEYIQQIIHSIDREEKEKEILFDVKL
jgi:hypothetical protein